MLSACGPYTKKERTQKLKETGDSEFIYQNELDKACFQHDVDIEILKIYLEERLQMQYYMINHIILQKFQNITDIKDAELKCFIMFLIKKL